MHWWPSRTAEEGQEAWQHALICCAADIGVRHATSNLRLARKTQFGSSLWFAFTDLTEAEIVPGCFDLVLACDHFVYL